VQINIIFRRINRICYSFPSFFIWPLLRTQCGCRGFCYTWSHSVTHRLNRTPLDEGSAPRRDLYLTTHDNYERQISMPTAGFEPAIPADERSQTLALDGTAAEIGQLIYTALLCQGRGPRRTDIKMVLNLVAWTSCCIQNTKVFVRVVFKHPHVHIPARRTHITVVYPPEVLVSEASLMRSLLVHRKDTSFAP
jgi:hypothetical protein